MTTKISSNLTNIPLGTKNAIINGNFDVWQRATSQTSSGFGSDDRWVNNNAGSTKTASQQSFTLGQTDVPNNPKYYSRTVVTTSAGVSNYVRKVQRIEDVSTFSGQTATLSFWAKADAAKDISSEFIQDFGSGGSPSADVNTIGVTTFSLTTSWTKYTVSVAIPSVSGKTLGTNNNDRLELFFWFDAGSDFNSRTNSLGQQSGTFDIAQVQIELGSVATNFEMRSIGEELALCQRYYLKIFSAGTSGYASGASQTARTWTTLTYPVTMRAVPTYDNSNAGFQSANVTAEATGSSITESSLVLGATSIAAGSTYFKVTSGYIDFDAEL